MRRWRSEGGRLVSEADVIYPVERFCCKPIYTYLYLLSRADRLLQNQWLSALATPQNGAEKCLYFEFATDPLADFVQAHARAPQRLYVAAGVGPRLPPPAPVIVFYDVLRARPA